MNVKLLLIATLGAGLGVWLYRNRSGIASDPRIVQLFNEDAAARANLANVNRNLAGLSVPTI